MSLLERVILLSTVFAVFALWMRLISLNRKLDIVLNQFKVLSHQTHKNSAREDIVDAQIANLKARYGTSEPQAKYGAESTTEDAAPIEEPGPTTVILHLSEDDPATTVIGSATTVIGSATTETDKPND